MPTSNGPFDVRPETVQVEIATPGAVTGHPSFTMNVEPTLEDIYTLVSDLYGVVAKQADFIAILQEKIAPVAERLSHVPMKPTFGDLMSIVRSLQ